MGEAYGVLMRMQTAEYKKTNKKEYFIIETRSCYESDKWVIEKLHSLFWMIW